MSPRMLSVLIGSLVVAVLSSSYLTLINCLCCAGIIAGAIVAVAHYTSTQTVTITSGAGAGMGAVAAVIGAFIAFLLDFPLSRMGIGSTQVWSSAMGLFHDMIPPDEAVRLAEQMEAQRTLAMRLINAVFGLLISAIFGAVGGALGAALFKKGEAPPAEPPGQAPPAAPEPGI